MLILLSIILLIVGCYYIYRWSHHQTNNNIIKALLLIVTSMVIIVISTAIPHNTKTAETYYAVASLIDYDVVNDIEVSVFETSDRNYNVEGHYEKNFDSVFVLIIDSNNTRTTRDDTALTVWELKHPN